MRDLIPELPDLQRLMMPGGSGTKQQVWSKCTHEEIPFKRCNAILMQTFYF